MPIDQRRYTAASPSERRNVVVTREEIKKRTEYIEALMIQGVPLSRIESSAKTSFSMSRNQVATYMTRIREKWSEEEQKARPHYKAQAMRRILGHIAQAKGDKNWAAVAQFEKLLAEMQGTKEAVEVHLNVDVQTTEAVLHVISGLSPERRTALIEEQRRLRALAAAVTSRPVPADTPTVPATVEDPEK